MDKTLLIFFIKRLLLVFSICFLILAIIDYVNYGGVTASTIEQSAIWSAFAALVSTAIATYWAYKKRCKMVYKD